MDYRITGLEPEPFRHLFGLPDHALAAHRVERREVDQAGAFPDRIGMRDLEVGETALLLNFTHQPDGDHYRSSHAIFVSEDGRPRYDEVGRVPDAMLPRTLSLRAFDARHSMVDADLVEGRDVEGLIRRLLADSRVAYVHAHYARRGCFAGRIERA